MRHRFHALCPYFAMFPESFAEHWIERLSSEGDVVLDPFCGRGTTPFQALLMGRKAVAGDINPVAYCVTRAKTNAPTARVLRGRLTALENRLRGSAGANRLDDLPEFFHVAYSENTLKQLLYLRSQLKWWKSDVDCMLAALVSGSLHGESNRSSSYLSNQMPRTISTKPAYSVRFWRKHGFVAPERDVFRLLRDRIAFRYASERPGLKASVFQTDFRSLPRKLRSAPKPIRLVITSPPYLGITRSEEDQWLRLWFLGGPGRPTYGRVSRDDRHENPDGYWRLIADMWRMLGRVVDSGAHVVVRLGGRKLSPDEVVSGLDASSVFSGRTVRIVSSELTSIQNRQTGAFRPGSKGCRWEVDCCFRVE